MPEKLTKYEQKLFVPADPIIWQPLNSKKYKVGTAEAVKNGISPQGLYFPSKIPNFTQEHYDFIAKSGLSQAEITARLMAMVFGDIKGFRERLIDRWNDGNLDLCINPIDTNNMEYALNLGTGPTLAFKDYAATVLSSLSEVIGLNKVILVATSGDTGGAIANAFASNKDGAIPVIVFYPKGRVTDVQRQFITTTGKQNIIPIEIDASFDDCQALVKGLLQAESGIATTANSINPARCYSQITQFALMLFELEKMGLDPMKVGTILGIPSGNFGHGTAATFWQLMTRSMRKSKGTIDKLVLSRNINGMPGMTESKLTLSSAMDVVNPNNYGRYQSYLNQVQGFMGNNWSQQEIITDQETGQMMIDTLQQDDHLLDPHSATARVAFKRLGLLSSKYSDQIKISAQTADPTKLPDEVNQYTGFTPQQISQYTKIPVPFDGTKPEVFAPYSPQIDSQGKLDLQQTVSEMRGLVQSTAKSFNKTSAKTKIST
jgi:threonine synthase